MISNQDKLSILITFTIGLVAGFYFFFNGFGPSSDVSEADLYSDFAIEGKAYGNCKKVGCLSFQLLADGSYQTLIDDLEKGQIRKNGIINPSLKKELISNINSPALITQSKKNLGQNCASSENGIDYNFTITLTGKEYELDTCKTNVAYDSKAWESLGKLWKYLENGAL